MRLAGLSLRDSEQRLRWLACDDDLLDVSNPVRGQFLDRSVHGLPSGILAVQQLPTTYLHGPREGV